jgi:hypothetical protein
MALPHHGHANILCSRLVRPSAGIRVSVAARHVSSKTQEQPLPAQPASTAHDVNPPASTRPAELALPAPVTSSAPTSDKLKRYIALGRAYLGFYKTGLKNVYHNYRASIPVRRALGLPAFLPTSPPPPPAFREPLDPSNSPFPLSRSSFLLVRRAAYDVRRIIPFSITLVICGEFTPLLVLVLGNAITPSTCRIPKQIAQERARLARRKSAALLAAGGKDASAAGSEEELDLLARRYADAEWVQSASVGEVRRACAVFGLGGGHDGLAARVLAGLVYRRRLGKHAAYLEVDDGLIVRGGGVGEMQAEEVRTAVVERGGVDVVGLGREEEEKAWLERWLQRRRVE